MYCNWSWGVIMTHHETSLWFIMVNHHDASWRCIIMTHHESSSRWIIMIHHGESQWFIPTSHGVALKGFLSGLWPSVWKRFLLSPSFVLGNMSWASWIDVWRLLMVPIGGNGHDIPERSSFRATQYDSSWWIIIPHHLAASWAFIIMNHDDSFWWIINMHHDIIMIAQWWFLVMNADA